MIEVNADIPEAVMSRFPNASRTSTAFYRDVASRILKRLPSPDFEHVRVHIYERLWAPHGLVRYGVAPDHPEGKVSSSWA